MSNKVKYTNQQLQLIKEVEEARQEWDQARNYFEYVNEKELIDYAIFKEQAARARYIYLILQARKMGIKVTDYSKFLHEASSE
ncbi:MAG: YaaL family protein [Bacillota bacterium]|nr:YaaL family protein [Bacillota bacterium]